MPDRYWLIHANGGRQLIDPLQFNLTRLEEQARRVGGRLVVESSEPYRIPSEYGEPPPVIPREPSLAFEPPVSALPRLFRERLGRIHECRVAFEFDVNTRPTNRVLGNYYKTKRLVRIYSHDKELGRRPVEELFDTFLHEVAHHLEYTEHDAFNAQACGRVPGRMHSDLFWEILGELKTRWAVLQRIARASGSPFSAVPNPASLTD